MSRRTSPRSRSRSPRPAPRHRARVDPAGAVAQLRPPRPGSDDRICSSSKRRQRADRRDAQRRRRRSLFGPTPGSRRTSSGARNAASSPVRHVRDPARLPHVRRDLAHHLAGGDAQRGRQPHVVADRLLDDRRLLRRVTLGQHQVALVDPDPLHDRCVRARCPRPAATTRGRRRGPGARTRPAGSAAAPPRSTSPIGCRTCGPRSSPSTRRRARAGRLRPPAACPAAPAGGAARRPRRRRRGRDAPSFPEHTGGFSRNIGAESLPTMLPGGAAPVDSTPALTHDSDKLIRQLSLVAYLMAEQRPVTARDVKNNVEGYANMGDEAFARRYYADRSELPGPGSADHVRPRRVHRRGAVQPAPGALLPAADRPHRRRAGRRCRPASTCSRASSHTPSRCAWRCRTWRWAARTPPTPAPRRPPSICSAASTRPRSRSGSPSWSRPSASSARSASPTGRPAPPPPSAPSTPTACSSCTASGTWSATTAARRARRRKTFRISRMRGEIKFATRRERDFRIPADFNVTAYRDRKPWQLERRARRRGAALRRPTPGW